MTVREKQQQNKDNNHEPEKKHIPNTNRFIFSWEFNMENVVQVAECDTLDHTWAIPHMRNVHFYSLFLFLTLTHTSLNLHRPLSSFHLLTCTLNMVVSYKWWTVKGRKKLKFKVYYQSVGTINGGKKRYTNGWGKMTRRRFSEKMSKKKETEEP